MPILKRIPDTENKGKTGEKKVGEQMQHVGLVLRARRREMNMSQASLAEKMQTSQEVISNYENGVTPVRADDLPRFASILAVTPTYFFEPNQQNQVASAQYQPEGARYQPGGVQQGRRVGIQLAAGEVAAPQYRQEGIQPAAGEVGTVAEMDSKATAQRAAPSSSSDHALSSEHAPKQSSATADPAGAARITGEARIKGEEKPEASDSEPNAPGYDALASDALASDALEYDAAKYDAEKCNALPLRALSEADLEKVMLTCYRALGSRMRVLAVKLIRDIAQDEREPAARIVVWKAKS